MKKVISLMLSMILLLVLASSAMSESQGTDYYVYTKNGKGLNVRSSMSAADDSNIIGSLPYGTKVITYGVKDGWAMIDYKNTLGYIMFRFLVKTKPAPYKPSDPSEQKTAGTANSSTVTQMNALIASAKYVDPYTVTVRPVRASGWVYMRWFPSRTAHEMATFGANYQLTVIAELKDWYQVSDPATGKVGFIYKSYVQ